MKKVSFKIITTLWITLLIAVICGVSIIALVLISRKTADDKLRQMLITAAQSNSDEMEFSNGIFEVENDFMYYSDGVYCDLFGEDGGYIRGETPHTLIEAPSDLKKVVKKTFDGKAHYDVEFGYNGLEYDYEVAFADGSVLKAEKEAEKAKVSEKKNVAEKSEASVSKEEKKNNNGYISVEAAKQKALNDAGVKAEEAVFVKAYYDSDDLVPHYDVKFEANGYEYEYEVKASDGSVLEKDVDRERKPVANSAPVSNEYVSEEKAKSAAYEHAGVNAEDVKFAKAELDRDDLIVHYDVEFVVGNFEYEYEVNAKSGKVVAFDKEFND